MKSKTNNQQNTARITNELKRQKEQRHETNSADNTHRKNDKSLRLGGLSGDTKQDVGSRLKTIKHSFADNHDEASRQKYAPKNLDAMRGKKYPRSGIPVNTLKEETADTNDLMKSLLILYITELRFTGAFKGIDKWVQLK
jgi:hypothetical protein